MLHGASSLAGVVRLVTLLLASLTLVAPFSFIPVDIFEKFESWKVSGSKLLEDLRTFHGIIIPLINPTPLSNQTLLDYQIPLGNQTPMGSQITVDNRTPQNRVSKMLLDSQTPLYSQTPQGRYIHRMREIKKSYSERLRPLPRRKVKRKKSWKMDDLQYIRENNIPLNHFTRPSIVLLKEGRSAEYCVSEWQDEQEGSIAHIVCDFTAANESAVVLAHPAESGTDPAEPTSAIYLNAHALYLADICNTVSVKDSALFFYRSGKACQPTVVIQNCSSPGRIHDHFQSLIVADGKFADMTIETVSLELNHLTAMNLNITQRSSGLDSYESLADAEAVAGIDIANTKLRSMQGRFRWLFSMSNTTVDYIKKPGLNIESDFREDRSYINNCSFGVIMEEGLQLTHSDLFISNTKFAQGNRRAIRVSNNAALILQDVSFVSAEHGMIVVDHDSILRLNNVTVGGKRIDQRSQFILLQRRELDVNVDLTENTTECVVTNQTADCDFAAVEKDISLNSHDDHPDLHITLRNAATLMATVTCPKSVTFINVTGDIYGYNACPNPINITAVSSRLDITIFSVNVLTLSDSEVEFLHLSPIDSIGLMTFTNIEFAMLQFNVSERGAVASVWTNATVSLLDTSYTAKPLIIQNSYIFNPIGELTYDHPNQTSVMRNVVFDFEPTSINVKAGTLEVDGLHFEDLYNFGDILFTLSKGAVLLVNNITLGNLPREKLLVMADTENQIVFGSEAMRALFEGRVVVLHVDKAYPYRVAEDSPQCWQWKLFLSWATSLYCNYSNATKGDVLLGHVPKMGHRHNAVTVTSASSLTVRDACYRRISLRNISSVDIRGQTLKCSPEFEALEVNFTGIYDEFDSFTGRNFSSPYLISGSRSDSTDFELVNAKIDALLALHGRSIVIENSKIANVTRLIAERKMKLSTSRFGVLHSNAIKVDEFGEVVLADSTIGFIKRQGISNAGNVNIMNTTIAGLQNHSFVLLPKSVTTLTNVDIGYIVGNPFVCSPGAHLVFNNVTLGGKQNLTVSHKIKIKGEDRNGKMTLSVNVPKYYSDEQKTSEPDDIKKFMASVVNDHSLDFIFNVARLQIYHNHFMDKSDVKFMKEIESPGQTESNNTKLIKTEIEGNLANVTDTLDLSTKEARGKNKTSTSTRVKINDGQLLMRRADVAVNMAFVFDEGGYVQGYKVALLAVMCSICSLLGVLVTHYQRQLRSGVVYLARLILPRPRDAAEPFAQQDQLNQVIENQHQLQDLHQ